LATDLSVTRSLAQLR